MTVSFSPTIYKREIKGLTYQVFRVNYGSVQYTTITAFSLLTGQPLV